MIDIKVWTEKFLAALDSVFPERVWFVGLQGSYGRNEATKTSDIDMVVILDELSPADISAYNDMLDTLPNRELICGFLSGKNELFGWAKYDLFQLYFDTAPIRGSLHELREYFDDSTVMSAIKIGACNIYHGCVHNMLYDKSDEILKSLYKSACFVVQAVYFKENGSYIKSQRELAEAVSGEEQEIVKTSLKLKAGEAVEFKRMSEALFLWAHGSLKNK